MAHWRARGLWQHPDFLRLWSGRAISELGSQISGQAVPLTAVLVLSAGPAQLGLLSALGSAPVLLVGLLAGVWADRRRRRPLLIAADVARAAILATIPLAALLGVLHVAQLYVVVALAGALTVIFDVADQSYLPGLVDREHLVEANSKLAATSSLAEVAGPALGGSLVQILTAPVAIIFDALSFLVSAVSIGAIRRPEPAPAARQANEESAMRSVWREIVEGVHLVWRHPVLRGLTAATATRSFFGNFFAALYTIYLVREIGASPALVGVLIGLGGLSSLPGALLAGPVARRFGLGRTLVASLAIWSGFSLLTPLAPPGHGPGTALPLAIMLLAASQLFGDWAGTIFFVTEISTRQAVTPDHLLGRMNASVRTVVGGVAPIGALVGGLLGERVGMRPTLLIAALGGLAAVIWLLVTPLRSRYDQPGAAPG